MNYHFIGIGGISMSGIARYLRTRGDDVSGCDWVPSKMTDALKRERISVQIGHGPEHIKNNIDRVVYNIRVPSGPGKIEIVEAKKRGIETIDRLALISELASKKNSIAVAGMHGKTTTTAMLGLILQEAGKDPDVLLGGNFSQMGGNVRVGRGEYFLYEACEYDPAFSELAPNFAIITNIEKEHLDRFKDLDQILSTFEKFIGNIDPKGVLVVYGDDENIKKVIKAGRCNVIRFGFAKDNDFVIEKSDRQGFKIKNKDYSFELELKVPGKHNIVDAAAAAILAREIGIGDDEISQVLARFNGVDRRIEIKARTKNVIIIDDYAHNPTEILTTLQAVSEFYPGKRLTVVFRPSQYSRNEAFKKEYGRCFKPADKVILLATAIPPGKEAESKNTTSQDLVAEIKKNGKDVIFLKGFEATIDFFQKNPPKDILITMGLGNIYELAEELARKIK